MTDRPLSPEDLALLTTERHGELIVRLRGDVGGGGDASPYNYGLWCGTCDMLLGRLGIFRLRVPDVWETPYAHRIAHCGRCHATTYVREGGGRAEIGRVARPSIMGDVCTLCGTAATPTEGIAADDSLAIAGPTSLESLVAKNRVRP